MHESNLKKSGPFIFKIRQAECYQNSRYQKSHVSKWSQIYKEVTEQANRINDAFVIYDIKGPYEDDLGLKSKKEKKYIVN